MNDLIGRTLGKYRIVARLGRGGMAEVYKAYQPGLDRYVAIKVLHGHLAEESDFIGRFKREAAAIASLRHPNIVQVYDFDIVGDLYYMVMEFIEGPTLKAELKERSIRGKPFTLAEVARIFCALASAIDYAHSRGMVHRDLKPANIMFTHEGQVVLSDFGIARIMGASALTMTGAISGTPAYMSPEQGQGHHGDERSDIYALGVILYEMVTGTVPFDADTPLAIIMKHIHDPLPLPRTLNPDLPEAVERIILKALSKNPDDRYSSAGEMARALREAVGLSADDTLAITPATTIAPPPRAEGGVEAPRAPAVPTATPPAVTVAAATPGRGIPVLPLAIVGGVLVVGCVVALVLLAPYALRSIAQWLPTPTGSVALTSATAPAPSPETSAAVTATETLSAVTPASIGITVPPAADVTPTMTPTTPASEMLTPAVGEESPIPVTYGAARVTLSPTPGMVAAEADVIPDFASSATPTAPVPEETATANTSALLPTYTLPPTYTPLPTYTPYPTYTPPPTETPTPPPTYTPYPTYTPLPTYTPAAPPTYTPIAPATEGVEVIVSPTVEAVQPMQPAISGKLAVPVDDGMGHYDVVIYQLPQGEVVGKIPRARQPNFRADGFLAVNGEGGGNENIWGYNVDGSGGIEISASPEDHHPFWKFDGNGLVYDNPGLVCAKRDCPEWHIFVQNGLAKPDPNVVASKLIIAGDVFRDQPLFPLWAADDYILFRGCDIWLGGSGGSVCGIWRTPSWATAGATGYTVPLRLTDRDDIPTDTKGDRLVFMSLRDGNWEVYVTSIVGGAPINLSAHPGEDGLGTLSPDGRWVAFVSTRAGRWGVWVVPSAGGEALPLPITLPGWGSGMRDWTTERISWGP